MNCLQFCGFIIGAFLLITQASTHEHHELRKREAEASLESYAIEKCESKLASIFEDAKESEEEFESGKFCVKLSKAVEESCKSSVVAQCKKAPWKWVRFACEEYLAGWICG